MASPPQSKLPIIELNEKNMSGSCRDEWKSTSDSVREALELHGCFVIEYSGMSSELYEAMHGVPELFDFPKETKMKFSSELAGFGYGGNYHGMPLFEYFGIQHEADDHLQSIQNFAAIFWPAGNPHFSKTLHSYCHMLSQLDRTVTKMLSSSYGLDKYYDPLITSSFYMSRLLKYHVPDGGSNDTSIGLMPHRDKGFLAILGSNDVKGLMIQSRDGDWTEFEPSPRRFIVIVGEALVAWSNGRLYCPLHRVVMRGIRERYSIALFSFVGGIVQVPEELVDDQNPIKFKPFNHLDFLDYCKAGGKTIMTGAIHTYCGL